MIMEIRNYMLERFLKYVTFDTESNDSATTVPTTEGQFVFARFLEQELKDMGEDEEFEFEYEDDVEDFDDFEYEYEEEDWEDEE